MPTYEYHCSKCNATYDLRQGFDAPTEHLCEECKKGTAKRILHAPRVLFKGSGFYVTDSKSKSSASADTAPSSTPSTSGSDTKSTSTESSPSSSGSSSSTPASTPASD